MTPKGSGEKNLSFFNNMEVQVSTVKVDLSTFYISYHENLSPRPFHVSAYLKGKSRTSGTDGVGLVGPTRHRQWISQSKIKSMDPECGR